MLPSQTHSTIRCFLQCLPRGAAATAGRPPSRAERHCGDGGVAGGAEALAQERSGAGLRPINRPSPRLARSQRRRQVSPETIPPQAHAVASEAPRAATEGPPSTAAAEGALSAPAGQLSKSGTQPASRTHASDRSTASLTAAARSTVNLTGQSRGPFAIRRTERLVDDDPEAGRLGAVGGGGSDGDKGVPIVAQRDVS